MEYENDTKPQYSLQTSLAYFIAAAPLVNLVALFQIHQPALAYIAQFLAFLYIIITPGLFLLPFLTKRKMPFMLGVAFSVALSIFMLMFFGLIINTVLPLVGIQMPLSVLPLVITFDAIIFILFALNRIFETDFELRLPRLNGLSISLIFISVLLPVLSVLGALLLNNGQSNILTMAALGLVVILVPVVVLTRKEIDEPVKPVILYMMALSFLLMNSMRGWFITGHDILLEYHVFTLTNDAHHWLMSLYQDPYMACLSLTIFPTYLQNLMHVASDAYIFKFFIQFVGALPVVVVYYISKQYVSEKLAFLAAFIYITFPTFTVDMAFLNRQGIAFLFFGLMVFVLFSEEYVSEKVKMLILFILGTGMVFSHYSTSYIAVPLLIATYLINKILRFIMTRKRPRWLVRLTDKVGNKEVYEKKSALKFIFVIGLLVIMVVWSTFITKTSTSFINTIKQIGTSLTKPFSLDEQTGPAKYSILSSQTPSPQVLFNQFLDQGIKNQKVNQQQSEFFPLALTESYPTKPVSEYIAPLTKVGHVVQGVVRVSLTTFFAFIKQAYAKILQLLLLVGLIGLGLGYSFKEKILHKVPVEFISISFAGIVVLVGQTVLPANAIDYGLLRLFQQNLIYLCLPILLGLMAIIGMFTKNARKQLAASVITVLFFFIILSGLLPQITGGARPLLPLNNDGLYYDSYYTHPQEVASADWLAKADAIRLPIQAAHFSDIKMLAYGRVTSYIELLPETTKKDSYVYLNYDNVKTGNILEIINGYVVYYSFPMDFLNNNKNLVYSNGGSRVYR
ncbi:MAG TPA: DUF2206 domain-containing protein [Candidatus Paceibacterota bacterium]|jgi:uncharacterized membrane protein|nr:DUF2206 domain-containing protein [Candidatus Paceibacterota bacterium]